MNSKAISRMTTTLLLIGLLMLVFGTQPPVEADANLKAETLDYYVSYDLYLLESHEAGNFVRIVAQQDETTVTIEGIGPMLLDAGDMEEFNLGSGTHIQSDKPVTVTQYDDYDADWEMFYLPSTRDWGNNYWYPGLRTRAVSGGHNYYHLFLTSCADNTTANIDEDNDGIDDLIFKIDQGDVYDWSVDVTESSPSGSMEYSVDPRAGAHITSDNPIQVHAWSTHYVGHWFGSGYLVLPFEVLGINHYVPFEGTGYGDANGDRINVVATADNTMVSIDENNDGMPEEIRSLNVGEVWQYPEDNHEFLFGTHVMSDMPVGVLYTSPFAIQADGAAVQIVPEKSALTEYWNTVSNATKTMTVDVTPYIHIFAFQNDTVVNIDLDNDGLPETTYIMDAGDGGVTYSVTTYGEHVSADKPISIVQAWKEVDGASMSLIGFGYEVLLESMVDIDPDTLNLKSRGKWITAYVELPEGYNVSDIDISKVRLNGGIPAELHPTGVGDYDDDGILDLMVKFDRAEVVALLSVGEATLTITGEVNGIPFEGSDTIRVIG